MTPSEGRSYLGRLELHGIKLGLENITRLAAALGDPQVRFPSVHVAGTNGKGSVAAMLAGILTAHGFRTGLYTSPHLARVEERVRIDGRTIAPRRFLDRLEKLKGVVDRLMAEKRLAYHPTYFEVLTALAFVEFAERGVDVAVLEVGMGGRFDSTNVVRPIVSVITTIAKDHEMHLGATLDRIAFEKAGIVKPGVPVVCGVRGGAALQVIRRAARERRAPLVEVFGKGRSLETRLDRGGHRFVYRGERGSYEFTPGLAGRHQGANAATAVAAAEVLSRVWKPLDKAKVLAAIRDTRWEGRLETVRRRPLVLLDGAHNVEGAEALAAHIRDVVRRRVVLVFGAMEDKDLRAMARVLFPFASAVVLTRVPYRRAATPEALFAAAPPFKGPVVLEPDTRKAVELALSLSGGRAPVVIAGSLFLVGEVKRLGLF